MGTPRQKNGGTWVPRELKVMVRVNADEYEAMLRVAERQGRPLAQWARVVLMLEVERSDKAKRDADARLLARHQALYDMAHGGKR